MTPKTTAAVINTAANGITMKAGVHVFVWPKDYMLNKIKTYM